MKPPRRAERRRETFGDFAGCRGQFEVEFLSVTHFGRLGVFGLGSVGRSGGSGRSSLSRGGIDSRLGLGDGLGRLGLGDDGGRLAVAVRLSS